MPERTLARSERALHGSERAFSRSERVLSNCYPLHGRITKVTEPTGVPQPDGDFGWQALPQAAGPDRGPQATGFL